jgi:hypothetical protein
MPPSRGCSERRATRAMLEERNLGANGLPNFMPLDQVPGVPWYRKLLGDSFVEDVSASLAFYEEAFGLSRRFFHDDDGKAYGELETGAACLAFASLQLARKQLKEDVTAPSRDKPPQGSKLHS